MTESAHFRYRRDESEIPRARREVRRFLSDQRLGSDIIDDLELVVVELVTNAVEHGAGQRVGVELEIIPDVVSISVEHEGGADLGDPSNWDMPPKERRSGRGLALVRRLVDDVEWSATAGRLNVRVARRYRIG